MNIVSWNVNGIRAAVKKDFFASMQSIDPDILCLQETKAHVEDVENALEGFSGYYQCINSAEKKGYSGTMILSKREPLATQMGLGVKKHDLEGRVITAEFENFYLITVYTPNSGRGLKRLEYRKLWDKAFRSYAKKLQQDKPIIICGDLNVAHQPIDLANPKSNYNKTAGYTQDEIDGFKKLLDIGLVDTYRNRCPDTVAYTYWNYMFNARARNVGWRLDYFLVSHELNNQIKEADIHSEIMGSDHCPVGVQF